MDGSALPLPYKRIELTNAPREEVVKTIPVKNIGFHLRKR